MDSLFIEKIKVKIKQIREKMSTFDAYFTKGLELYENKKYKLAADFFKIALSQSNAKEYANYNLALAYQQIENFDEALKYYEKFIEYYPEDRSALYNIATVYYNKEDYKTASKYFLKNFEQEQAEDTAIALTKCYLKTNDMLKIMDLVDYIFNSNCKNKCAFEIAQAVEQQYNSIKNFETLNFALDIYLRLHKIDNKDFDTILAISLVYAKKGDWTNAIKYCEKALEINPKSYEANNQMGLTYYCAENMEMCLHYYEKAFQINNKTDYKIYSNLAYAYEKIGRVEEAIDLFKDLITKFPTCPIKNEIKEHTKQLIQLERETA